MKNIEWTIGNEMARIWLRDANVGRRVIYAFDIELEYLIK